MEPQPPQDTPDTDELNTTCTLDPDMDKIQRTERTEQTPVEQCHRQLSREKSPTSESQQRVESQQHVKPQAKNPVQVDTSMYRTRPNRKYMN